MKSIKKCLMRLNDLGRYEYNYSLGECMQLERDVWDDPEQVLECTARFDQTTFGDVCARHELS